MLCSIEGITRKIHVCLEGGAGKRVKGRIKMRVKKWVLYFLACIFFRPLSCYVKAVPNPAFVHTQTGYFVSPQWRDNLPPYSCHLMPRNDIKEELEERYREIFTTEQNKEHRILSDKTSEKDTPRGNTQLIFKLCLGGFVYSHRGSQRRVCCAA